MAGEPDLIFGRLAVKHGLLSEPQLRDAIRIQEDLKRTGVEKTVGEILQGQGVLNPVQVQKLLQFQGYALMREEDRKYGQLAVRNSFCSTEDVQEALAIQQTAIAKNAPAIPRIGNILRDRGQITQQQHEALKKAQMRLGKVVAKPAAPTPAAPTPAAAVPSFSAVAPPAREPVKCPVCGDSVRPGIERCVVCGTQMLPAVPASGSVREEAADTSADPTLFGNTAVRLGLVSESQVSASLARQASMKSAGQFQRIGETMVAASYLTRGQVEQVVDEQLAARGELVLGAGGGSDRGRRAFANVIERRVPAGITPPEGGDFEPDTSGVSAARPSWPSTWFRGRMKYVVASAGLALILAIACLIYALTRGEETPKVADKSPESGAVSQTPAETAAKADLALKEAVDYEAVSTPGVDIVGIMKKYDAVALDFPGTPAAVEALERKRKHEAVLERTTEEFAALQKEHVSARAANDFDNMIGAVEAFIARVSRVTGRPLLAEATDLLNSAVKEASADIMTRIADIRAAIDAGKNEEAVQRFLPMRGSRVFAHSAELQRLFEQTEQQIGALQQRTVAEREKPEQTEAKHVHGRTDAIAALAEGEKLESESKFAEALLEFKKAMLFAGTGALADRAEEKAGQVQFLVEKTQAELDAKLVAARNWTAAKQYSQAIEICNDALATVSFSPFHEDFRGLVAAMTELEQNGGEPKALLKQFDEQKKAVDTWAGAQVVVAPDVRCAICDGTGLQNCEVCDDFRELRGKMCSGCYGRGQYACPSCGGRIQTYCYKCGGSGTVSKWNTRIGGCVKCNGTGWIKTNYKCSTCSGTGKVTTRTYQGKGTCSSCGGDGKVACTKCRDGKVPCTLCGGIGSTAVPCKYCAGRGKTRCESCGGSGLDESKF